MREASVRLFDIGANPITGRDAGSVAGPSYFQRWNLAPHQCLGEGAKERRAGRNAYYRLRPEGLAPLAGWVDRYRTFWPERIGKLKELLKDMDQ